MLSVHLGMDAFVATLTERLSTLPEVTPLACGGPCTEAVLYSGRVLPEGPDDS